MMKKLLRIYFIIATLLLSVVCVIAQPTDCVNAIPVCSNSQLSENSNGSGIDDFSNPNNESSCLLQGEHQSVWLYVRIENGSQLGFDLTPRGVGEDFDFAVYGPNVNCSNLGRPIRCSWAGFACGRCPSTGMDATSTDESEGVGGDGYVRWLDVTPGETYFILIDNFVQTDSGFTLNWTGDAQSLDCEITFVCPTVDLGNDTTICNGSSVEIGIGPVPTDTYLWNTGATSSLINVTTAGLYWLEVTRQGCVEYDTIIVSSDALTLDIGNDTVLCENAMYTINATSPAINDYLWQDNSVAPSFTINSPGIYWVEVSNDDCTARDSVVVSYVIPPVVDLGPDSLFCNRDTYTLNVPFSDGNTNYVWQDNSTASSYTVTQEGNYFVTVSNECGQAADTVFIRYDNCDCELYFPNTFTPNKDGFNDEFGPIIACDIVENYTLKVYNRYGESVFETTDINETWDGQTFTTNGLLDVYVWEMEYTYTLDGNSITKSQSGYITLLR